MTVRYFLDTNVLIYAAAGREDDPSKHLRALQLIEAGEFGLSAQVLQEFFVNITRKPAIPFSAAVALEWIERLSQQPCAPIDADLFKIAIGITQRYSVSYWDGAIIAAAETLGARTLYSEDLNHGQSYGSVRVENPFLAT